MNKKVYLFIVPFLNHKENLENKLQSPFNANVYKYETRIDRYRIDAK